MRFLVLCIILVNVYDSTSNYLRDRTFLYFDQDEGMFGSFSASKRRRAAEESKQMFYFGYDNYMKYAFPKDELDPIHCRGRGPDFDDPSNININDVLGDYSLTLVDSLDTLLVFGNVSEFQRAVKLVEDQVSFDKPVTVQLFEANIRVLGALLSAHLLITDPSQPFGDLTMNGSYDNKLLHLAHDLGVRLLSAFDYTNTGIPHPRVNLQTGVPRNSVNETCTAGAGTLRLEFGILSRLLNDPIYDRVAKLAVEKLWSFRNKDTGLFGNVINIQTGEWVGTMSGLGAGLDSFFEYLFKSFITFGDEDDLDKFRDAYDAIKLYMRRGRKDCNYGSGFPPIYVNVNMVDGKVVNNWVDSLQAAWSAVQVLAGDVEEAICSHAFYYAVWQKFGSLPERYNWLLHAPEVSFYPLRPEFVESTYYLYRATKNPFYLHVGHHILQTLTTHCKVKCGYATRHDVRTNELEDRMESFFLSETCKYLYLLFDESNHFNQNSDKYIFSTEGHVFPLIHDFRKKTFETAIGQNSKFGAESRKHSNVTHRDNCLRQPDESRFLLPIRFQYLQQVQQIVGV